MENTTDKKIKEFNIPFILGEETRPKIELFENNEHSVNIKNSIFYQQYCIALSGIAELIIYNNEPQKGEKQSSHNNIFIFTGDRGSGKTSCMLTVKELLCNKEHKSERYAKIEIADNLKDVLNNTSFYGFETIDPIFFDCQHNILDLFIGTLFKSFQDYETDSTRNTHNYVLREGQRERLLNLFSETKRNLAILNKDITLSEFDDLEQLNDLAASINFRNSIWTLVNTYISYMHSEGGELILCIDDIDLNMSEGYEMIEQIRKYLNIPKLIILMAIKIDQLANVIRIKYSNDFAPLLALKTRLNSAKKEYNETINEIVERYITKLFPLNQRIQLPSVSYLLNQNIGIFQYEKGNNLKRIDTLAPFKKDILRVIYNKIRLLTYNTTQQIHYIIPRNLREIFNLVHLLYSMKDASNHKEALPNLTRFKDYFYGVWCTNNLAEDDLAFIRSALAPINADIINQMVIRFLKRRFPNLSELENMKDEKDNSTLELINILNKKNVMYNISLGDVMACLDWLEKMSPVEKDQKIIYAIKTYYSICLYEGFRTKAEIIEEEKEIINKEKLTNNESNYGNILNGNFFNSEYLNAMPYESRNISRSRRIINVSEIENLWKDKSKRKIAEFFMLTTSFVIKAKEFEKENKEKGKEENEAFSFYRKKNEVYYEKNIVLSPTAKVCFDVLSIFYNLLDVSKAYERYKFYRNIEEKHSPLSAESKDAIKARLTEKYKKALETNQITDTAFNDKFKEIEKAEEKVRSLINNCPLYKDILDSVHTKEENENVPLYYEKEKTLLYALSIRNIELLEQISYSLQKKRPDGGSDNISLLKKVFSTLSKYKIQLYNIPNIQDNHAKTIEYNFFEAISKFLDELGPDGTENFNSIYSDISPANQDGQTNQDGKVNKESKANKDPQ